MQIEEKLREIGINPGKGQNFIENESIARALVEAGEVDGEKTLEIGPGTGVITRQLLEKTSDLVVVERNGNLARYLREEFPRIEVQKKDFLEMDLKDKGFERCVSNIPFQYSSEIVEKLGREQIQSALIVQDELADKWVAEPGDKNYGFATIKTQYFFLPVKLTTISSSNFFPEPEVDAAIIKLYPGRKRHGIEDEEDFFRLAKALFTHKRKKLRNAFVDVRHILGYEKDDAKDIRDELPHSEKRVNQLDIKQIVDVQKHLEEK